MRRKEKEIVGDRIVREFKIFNWIMTDTFTVRTDSCMLNIRLNSELITETAKESKWRRDFVSIFEFLTSYDIYLSELERDHSIGENDMAELKYYSELLSKGLRNYLENIQKDKSKEREK